MIAEPDRIIPAEAYDGIINEEKDVPVLDELVKMLGTWACAKGLSDRQVGRLLVYLGENLHMFAREDEPDVHPDSD